MTRLVRRTARSARQRPLLALLCVLVLAGASAVAAVAASKTPDFTIAATAHQSVYPGQAGVYTVSITPTNGFSGNVSLSVSGLPAGATATFVTNPLTSSTTSTSLIVNVGTSVPQANYSLTITGTSGSLSHTVSPAPSLAVVPASGFTLGLGSQSPATVAAGHSAGYPVTASRISAFNGAITFSTNSDLPAGVTASFSPNPTTATGTTSALTMAVPATVPNGSYPFAVNGVNGGHTTWVQGTLVVNTPPPPPPTITAGPANGSLTNQNSASFSFIDSQTGVSFLCKLDSGSFTACTSPANYSSLTDGSHTFTVEAKDPAGNISSGNPSRTWTVDTTPPAAPILDTFPPNPNDVSTSNFSWHDTTADVDHYICSTENGSFATTVPSADGTTQPCSSPLSYVVGTTNNGTHQFAVEAVDKAGNISGSTGYSWKVQKGSIQNFTITGDMTGGALVPAGPARAFATTIHNPNSVPVFVDSLTVSINASSLPAGCLASWFVITQSNASSGNTVSVPANGTATLPQGSVTAPMIQMTDSGNQDACKHATFTINYTGTDHS